MDGVLPLHTWPCEHFNHTVVFRLEGETGQSRLSDEHITEELTVHAGSLSVNAMRHNPGALHAPTQLFSFSRQPAPLQNTHGEISSSFPREMHERFPKTFSQLGASQCSLPYRQHSISKAKSQITAFSNRKQYLSRNQPWSLLLSDMGLLFGS